MNSILSICIPTYNREKYVGACIRDLIPQISKYDIPIYVSDNASEDNTRELIATIRANEYAYIFYSCNKTNIGPDKNFEKVLKLSNTKYAWLLGDDDNIVSSSIEKVLAALDKDEYDVAVVNCGFPQADGTFGLRVKDVQTNNICDKNLLLSKLGWHMTLLSSLIFSRELIMGGNYSKYYNSNFLQTAVIFEYLGRKPTIKVCWLADPCVTSYHNAGVAWINKTFDIFVKSWYDTIINLDNLQYSKESKLNCIMAHGIKSELFLFDNLLHLLKVNGVMTINNLTKYDSLYYKHTIPYPRWFLIYIAIAPMRWLKSKKTNSIAKRVIRKLI